MFIFMPAPELAGLTLWAGSGRGLIKVSSRIRVQNSELTSSPSYFSVASSYRISSYQCDH